MTPVRLRRRAGLSLSLLCSRLMALLALVLVGQLGVAVAGAVPGELPAHVGRLGTVAGEVQWYDRDSEGWVGTPQEPLRNWPVAAGDRLRTGVDGRAELRLGSTTLRLGPGSDVTLQRLDGRSLVLWLESGTLALRLSPLLPGDVSSVEVMTAEGRWLPRAPGHYRIDRQADGRTPATLATTWRGELQFAGRDSALKVPAQRRVDIWRDAAGSTRYAWAPVERDRFADWVARDERLDDAPVSARYVPAGMTGWQDLDRNGDWLSHPAYGQLWAPRQVPVGWAPFHDGRWAWVAPWGWTWIDAAPWGFAPFHYGSWVVWQDRWFWSPGPRHERPHYAPALRSWTGGPVAGGGGNIGIQIDINSGQRPPPPRVLIPVVLPPRMVVAPPTVIVINPPPRVWRGDAGWSTHEHERQGRYDPAPREHDRRQPDGRDGDRRDPERRDRAGPVPGAPTPAPVLAPVPTPVLPSVRLAPPVMGPVAPGSDRAEGNHGNYRNDRNDRNDRGERVDRRERGERVETGPVRPPVAPAQPQPPSQPAAPVQPVVAIGAVPAAGPAAPALMGPVRRAAPPVAALAVPPPAAAPTVPATPPPAAAPRLAAPPPPALPPMPPAPTAPAAKSRDTVPNRTDAAQRPERGDRGDRSDRVERGDRGSALR